MVALATLILLGIGGLVTSHEAGMAVPDWPNTYGYNMFLFPISKWMGGILYEHSHRLMASLVGLLTAVLAIWLWLRETKTAVRGLFSRQSPPRLTSLRGLRTAASAIWVWVRETRAVARWTGVAAVVSVLVLMGVRQMPVYIALASLAPLAIGVAVWKARQQPGTLRWWGIVAFAAVVLQGVLGGLRVVWLKDEIGIIHATLAQLFFVLLCGIALCTTGWWQRLVAASDTDLAGEFRRTRTVRRWTVFAAGLILAQLVLGATMRHQHAGLAIPDFPLAYGKLWPAMNEHAVTTYNQQRLEVLANNPITGFQIGLQMTHRILALLIIAAVAACMFTARRELGSGHLLSRAAFFWLILIGVQAVLGATTIWSNKAADLATAHVLVGALSLASGVLMSIVSLRGVAKVRLAASRASQAAGPFEFRRSPAVS
jgi:cytochrome c oxidase assembly protein subunit 15